MHTTTPNILDPYNIPLKSTNLIEASAGTGKSWTVSLLVLRLILEKKLSLDQILVVTFTEAAAKELRDAVRVRISEALTFFEAQSNDDNDSEESESAEKEEKIEYSTLFKLKNHGSDEDAIQRLKRAKLSIDESAIFTIHSFCQRALTEFAFEASLPFDSELMDDDNELMQKLTDDFWRKNFQTAPQSLLFKLDQKPITPESLLSDIRSVIDKPYLTLCGPKSKEGTDNNNEEWAELEHAFQEAIADWDANKTSLIELLSDPDREAEYYKALCDNRDEIFAELDCLADSKTRPSLINMTKMSWLGTKEKTKSKFESIDHSFCKKWQYFLDLWSELNNSSDDFIHQIRIDLLKHLQKELPKEKRRLGILSFSDLLLNLQQALISHPKLATALNTKYQAALIDEFQDTDAIQYSIFKSIYQNVPDAPVFLVGDPKQAIYSFRGGDIYTYLKAKEDTQKNNRYTIETNWRSHPKLIHALNNLYALTEDCFKDEGIKYIQINAGKKTEPDPQVYTKSSALRFWQCTPEVDDKGYPLGGMDTIKKTISNAIAGDITQLLNNPKNKVIGSDIAILVRSHGQGNLIKQALNARNIASVQSSKDSIYQTSEAAELLLILAAIVEPQQEDLTRQALVTELLGYCAEDLKQFEHSDQQPNQSFGQSTNKNADQSWEDILKQIQDWHLAWKNEGFLVMFKALMSAQAVHQRLLSYMDGERRLTNLLQLAELVHHTAKQQLFSMEEVLRWLKQQQNNSTQKDAELRLESDDKLVQIVTIWKSKGLEYPIVYCPFVGLNKPNFSDKVFSFYQLEKSKTPQACLEIGSDNAEQHKALKNQESDAEETRLLYVALTRAKYQCTVVCFPEPIKRNPDKSSLGWLLSKGETIKTKSYTKNYQKSINTLSKLNEVDVLPMLGFKDAITLKTKLTPPSLVAKSFTTRLLPQAQITSFSGLTANAHTETADHDAAHEKTIQLPPLLPYEFPRGATAGNALHEVFENLDFTQPVKDQHKSIFASLSKWGFNQDHLEAACLLMENSLQSPIASHLSLSLLSNKDRLNEMEFHLPLASLQLSCLKQTLLKHLPNNDAWQSVRESVNTLHFDRVKGYLKGFIDLIFVHNDQYYIADYKSNSLLDYEPDHLLPVIADAHYYLQYLLYSVALHRYLSSRISTYHWDTHVGGVYYLFIRGMSGTSSSYSGVFFDKPSLSLIEALDELFMRDSENV